MAKSEVANLKDLVGNDVTIQFVQAGTESISGTITKVKESYIVLTEENRGKVNTYRIPNSEIVSARAEGEVEFKSGVEVEIERSINKRRKVTGKVLGVETNGIMLYLGETRGKLETSFFPFTTIEKLSSFVVTKEGAARREAQSKRLKEARGGEKKAKKSEKASKLGKKSKK